MIVVSMTYIRLVGFGVAALLSTSAASAATLVFDRLAEDRFVLTHLTVLGGTEKARNVAYEKAASVCLAAGFSLLEVLYQEQGAGHGVGAASGGAVSVGFGATANASSTLLVRFKHKDKEEGESEEREDVLDCNANSVPRFVAAAKTRLARLDAGEESTQTKAAKLRFQRLAEDRFVVKQMRMGRSPWRPHRLFVKASALCVATGFSWLEVLEHAAGIRMVVHFKHEKEGEDGELLACSELSKPRYVEVAKKMLK